MLESLFQVLHALFGKKYTSTSKAKKRRKRDQQHIIAHKHQAESKQGIAAGGVSSDKAIAVPSSEGKGKDAGDGSWENKVKEGDGQIVEEEKEEPRRKRKRPSKKKMTVKGRSKRRGRTP